MKIGIDARLAGYREGGIGRYARSLAQAFATLDSADHFTVFQSWRDREPLAVGPRLKTRLLFTPPHHHWEQWLLPLELTMANIDLLHSTDFIPPFRRRFASVITIHDLAFVRMPNLMTGESYKYYMQVGAAVKKTNGIIADTEVTKQDIVDLLRVPSRAIDVVYPAPDSSFGPLGREQALEFCKSRGLPPSFIFWVGTIEPRKDLDTLLAAVPMIKGKLPPEKGTLVVAGSRGWLSDNTMSRLSSLERSGDAVYLGHVSQQELLYLYNAAWVFVFPSLYEGFGLPPLEAMACGTPVISSDAPAMPEVLGDAPVFFPVGDAKALAEAMLAIAEDSSLAVDLARRGVEQAAAYTWEKAAQGALGVYRKALG